MATERGGLSLSQGLVVLTSDVESVETDKLNLPTPWDLKI